MRIRPIAGRTFSIKIIYIARREGREGYGGEKMILLLQKGRGDK
jgi:hypothetical protein